MARLVPTIKADDVDLVTIEYHGSDEITTRAGS